jgi:hypothetical protein
VAGATALDYAVTLQREDLIAILMTLT